MHPPSTCIRIHVHRLMRMARAHCTCMQVHRQENEDVVAAVLSAPAGRAWRLVPEPLTLTLTPALHSRMACASLCTYMAMAT